MNIDIDSLIKVSIPAIMVASGWGLARIKAIESTAADHSARIAALEAVGEKIGDLVDLLITRELRDGNSHQARS